MFIIVVFFCYYTKCYGRCQGAVFEGTIIEATTMRVIKQSKWGLVILALLCDMPLKGIRWSQSV